MVSPQIVGSRYQGKGQAADKLSRVAALVANQSYELAARLLSKAASGQGNTSDLPSLDYAATLASRCQRLVTDRRRLQQVISDLELDEEITRGEIARILGVPLASSTLSPEVGGETCCSPVGRSSVAKPPLSLWLLGSFRLAFDGELVIGSEADRSTPVLRYLASLPPNGIHKEQLADLFWPGASPRTARRNVHQAVYTIRRILAAAKSGAEEELVFANDRYFLGRGGRWRDIDDLTHWVDVGRRARQLNDMPGAVAAHRRAYLSYGGEFLADYPYDEWAHSAGQHYRALHRESAATLLDDHARSGDDCGRLEVATRLLALDPTDEDAGRHLMTAYASLGEPHLAELACNRLIDALRDELGQALSSETVALATALIGTSVFDECGRSRR